MDRNENIEHPTGDHHEVQIDHEPTTYVEDEKKDRSSFNEGYEAKNETASEHHIPQTENEKNVYVEEDEQATSGVSGFLDRHRTWVRLVQILAQKCDNSDWVFWKCN